MKIASLLIGVLLVYFIARHLWCSHKFSTMLSERYPDVWASIGMPRLRVTFGTNYSTNWRAMKYIMRRRYLAIDDKALQTVGDKTRTSFICLLALFASDIAFTVAIVALKHW